MPLRKCLAQGFGEKLFQVTVWGQGVGGEGLEGRGRGKLYKERQSCCFRDTSCTCTTANDFEVIFSSMSKESDAEEKVLTALHMPGQ